MSWATLIMVAARVPFQEAPEQILPGESGGDAVILFAFAVVLIVIVVVVAAALHIRKR